MSILVDLWVPLVKTAAWIVLQRRRPGLTTQERIAFAALLDGSDRYLRTAAPHWYEDPTPPTLVASSVSVLLAPIARERIEELATQAAAQRGGRARSDNEEPSGTARARRGRVVDGHQAAV